MPPNGVPYGGYRHKPWRTAHHGGLPWCPTPSHGGLYRLEEVQGPAPDSSRYRHLFTGADHGTAADHVALHCDIRRQLPGAEGPAGAGGGGDDVLPKLPSDGHDLEVLLFGYLEVFIYFCSFTMDLV